MCDAWLARMLAGDQQSIEVLAGAWAAVRTFGWETRRLGCHRFAVSSRSLRRVVSETGGHQRGVAGLRLRRAFSPRRSATRRRRSCSIGVEPRHPFDEELINYVRGVLYFRTGRWPDVLAQFPEGTHLASTPS